MISGMAEQPADDFVPTAPRLWIYDALSFLLSGARRWRPALLAQNAPSPGDVTADIGCGTGTQLRLLARECSSVTLIGIDPDAAIRRRARRDGRPCPPRNRYQSPSNLATIL